MDGRVFDNYKNWLLEQAMPKGKRNSLLAALDLFAKYGYDGTSTAQVAAAAGVSQATIFKYFKTKQDLLKAIIKPVLENFFPVYRDDLLAELRRYNSLEELVHFLVRDRYRFMVENGDAAMILLTEVFTNEEVRKLFIAAVNNPEHSLVQGLNQALLQTGEVRPELDAAAVVRTIIGQLAVYFLQQRFAGNGNEVTDLKLIEGQIVRALRK
ncbi:TetR/AcrR family transcriptional regulator [Pediococcus acidilactici]